MIGRNEGVAMRPNPEKLDKTLTHHRKAALFLSLSSPPLLKSPKVEQVTALAETKFVR